MWLFGCYSVNKPDLGFRKELPFFNTILYTINVRKYYGRLSGRNYKHEKQLSYKSHYINQIILANDGYIKTI